MQCYKRLNLILPLIDAMDADRAAIVAIQVQPGKQERPATEGGIGYAQGFKLA
jgi:hypothetical protein